MNKLICYCTIVFLISCTNYNSLTEKEKSSIKTDITTMLENYHLDMNKDGLMAEFKYLDESEDFFWVPPGFTSPLTFDSVKSILITNSKALSSVNFSWDILQVYPHYQKIASYSGIVNGIMTDTSGMQNRMRIIESGTIIKRQDGWKLLNGQSAVLNDE